MLDELGAAGALAAVKSIEVVAPPALLAEALQYSTPQKLRLLDVLVADAAPLVVCCQTAQILRTLLHLPPVTMLCIQAWTGTQKMHNDANACRPMCTNCLQQCFEEAAANSRCLYTSLHC